ncbi:hypothetical protein F511_37517 [Dorcoceras hygrometricum]|uniref:Uncharacterized protein n=1 Tax=Dorcoceras hygrometricum TaxID=472368 RepID=A0A2Z7C738_9LAMI|nr:hypothetical protein F511_37517 [Dorcoceras hygrometricum]
MGCPGQARTKLRTQNSRRNAATGTPEGGRTVAPAVRAACGSYSADVRLNFRSNQNWPNVKYWPENFMGCPGQARTKLRTQNSRRNAATGTPEGGRTVAPAVRAACGSYSADVRRLQCRRAAAIVSACGGYSAVDPSLGSDTTVGEVADPDPVSWGRNGSPRLETRILRQPALEGLTSSPRTESPRHADRNKSDHTKNRATAAAGGGRRLWGGRLRRGVEERVGRLLEG